MSLVATLTSGRVCQSQTRGKIFRRKQKACDEADFFRTFLETLHGKSGWGIFGKHSKLEISMEYK